MRQRHPKEMFYLAVTEMCQRFAFWGIAGLLVIYLVQIKKFSDSAADQLFGVFTGLAFFLPIVGGYISDKLNYRSPVMWGISLTGLGCFLIATGNLTLILISLFLVAIGASLFTPGIYALLGCLYTHAHDLRESGFSIYYSAVNLGVFLSMIVLGALGQAGLWHLAFALAGIIQFLGLYFFKKALKNPQLQNLSAVRFARKSKKSPKLHRHEKDRIWVICILSLFSILFWMAYNQGGSSMNLFALRFTNRGFFGFNMPPTWLLASESLYLILLAFPLACLYVYLTKKKCNPTPQAKSAYSLFSMGICFLIMTIGARAIPSGAASAMVNPFYLFIAYAFMALGEMLIAPIGLSLVTHLSPHRFTAFLIGVWYCCIGIAFYAGGAIAPLMSKLNISAFFSLFVLLAVLFGVILLLLSKKLNAMRHLDTL
ncbi:MAG TPA: peptide MFS transporter [Rhabdochlamydiaceae bacterium]